MDMIHTCPQDGAYSDVVHAFQGSMRKLDEVESCPGKPWFSASHVAAAVSEKRLKWKAFLSRKTPEVFKSYREARSNVVAVVKKAKADLKCSQIENAEAQHAVGDVKRLINELKSGLGPH
ncbi:hypothetical protein Pmar_PMAR010683 [Perkinsus marinus ATCC 50983]|uniref:Uncharacterized protein n=1 Tax=Perkinsus marinus (strain ATCC 50983 / TXsc) TaxID=423536 RepID=C5LWA5_PERM5|nr:hypothetical protein Pmar_PMAR010683 [Perkinsus marinus ATCC 50983]EEQ98987.1 hypothetical protein Pmar_PMAR010683 [Perkinsus marinus ATCC 50983]|eukprot:XP_002766270.1 hypothetical protein Pmar_PMAR010683 [Perkinsus marinus ATCC 50983]